VFSAAQPPDRPTPPRRRTVRIVKPRSGSRAGAISLAAVIGAAVLFLIVRYSLRSEETVQPFVRTFSDLEVDWKCEAGHTFRAAGQVEPRRCWTCNAAAFPVRRAACPVHGETEIWVRFSVDADGTPRPSSYRTVGGEWTDAATPPICPKCKRDMQPVREDPLAKLKSKKLRSADPDGVRREP